MFEKLSHEDFEILRKEMGNKSLTIVDMKGDAKIRFNSFEELYTYAMYERMETPLHANIDIFNDIFEV